MLKRYLFMSFAQVFFPFFVVLLFIASVVLLIDIAGRTYVVKMSFLDLGTLFLYLIPSSLFFIIPITFFTALVLSISRLAYEYELLVCFSLGSKPFDIVRFFFPIILLATLILFVFSLIMLPLANSASKNFVAQKRADINVNIKPGEFGQKLGDWLVYMDSVSNRNYQNLILFSENGFEGDTFIVAQEGKTNNNQGLFELNLSNGSAYFAAPDEIKRADYRQMSVRQNVSAPQLRGYDLIEYWSDAFMPDSRQKSRKLAQAVLVSLFPLVSIFLIPLFGIANPRFSSNMSYGYVIAAVSLYFVCMHIISDNFPLIGMGIFPLLWFYISFMLYRKFISKFY
ncbi:LptF/LptG family permease [Helicobacter sp. MIT 03-1616]|uniref:LptF/LptG family permease n=1 Tax=Helicobacter sp. MIT 03-1616 TaxID=1548148 RepID=UPI00051DF0A6|nr:LptF/LptG family permease [Helicobacter sp. MIT 03-1616]TLD89754.1 LptF/LptG family permease [Helicobacter sp. MIT 03-1616]